MRPDKFFKSFVFISIPLTLSFCSAGGASALELKSDAFEDGESIPERYTYKGENVSPPLSWSGAPRDTKSFVLIMDDPDAPVGTWVHWVVYGISANMSSLEENMPKEPVLESGIKQGINSFKEIGYGGPQPPPGPAHRYVFKLHALNSDVEVSPGISKESLLRSIEGHILEKAELVGLFKR